MLNVFNLFSISAGVGALLLIVGIVGLLSKSFRGVLRSIPYANKLFSPMVWSIIFIVIGVVAGGTGVLGGYIGGTTASVTGVGASNQNPVNAGVLDHCTYSAGSAGGSGITIRQDTNSNNVIFLDVKENTWNSTNNAAGDFNVSFNCDRLGSDIDKAQAIEFDVKGDVFGSETSTTDSSSRYNILATTNRPSDVFDSSKTQTVYVGDGAFATTSDPKEKNFLTYTQGDKTLVLGVQGELDLTSYQNLNNYTQKNIVISSNGVTAARIVVNKIPS